MIIYRRYHGIPDIVGRGGHVRPALPGSRGTFLSSDRTASRNTRLLRQCTAHTVDILSQQLGLTSGSVNSKVRGRTWNGARTAGEINVFRACRSVSLYSSQPNPDHSVLSTHTHHCMGHEAWETRAWS